MLYQNDTVTFLSSNIMIFLNILYNNFTYSAQGFRFKLGLYIHEHLSSQDLHLHYDIFVISPQ